MKNFKTLIEQSVGEAQKILGLSGNYTPDELKSAYRRASQKAHPDKGGSVEQQKKINVAYDFLKKTRVAVQNNDSKREGIWKLYREGAVLIRDDLVKNFKVDVYSKFFSETFGEEFKGVVLSIKPEDKDIQKEGQRGAPNSVELKLEWNNASRTKVFQLSIWVTLANIFGSGKGLATSASTYPMSVSTFAYLDNRKVKITSRDYTESNKKAVFNTPEIVFPKNKIIRTKQTKFKRSDMESALKAEIRAKQSGEFWFIPLNGDKYLALTRGTMRRQAYWSIQGVWFLKSKYSWKRDEAFDRPFISFDESEKTLSLFKKSKNMDPAKVLKMFEDEYKRQSN